MFYLYVGVVIFFLCFVTLISGSNAWLGIFGFKRVVSVEWAGEVGAKSFSLQKKIEVGGTWTPQLPVVSLVVLGYLKTSRNHLLGGTGIE